MTKVTQIVVMRTERQVDEGTMGFHDWVTKSEPYLEFINRVTDEANDLISKGHRIISISYPSENIGVISCLKSHD